MHTFRYEPLLELSYTPAGCRTEADWVEVPWRYKVNAGYPFGTARPRFVWGHLPRLDWRIWFLPLRARRLQAPPPWFHELCKAVLEGRREVLDLLNVSGVGLQDLKKSLGDKDMTEKLVHSDRKGGRDKREPYGRHTLQPLSLRCRLLEFSFDMDVDKGEKHEGEPATEPGRRSWWTVTPVPVRHQRGLLVQLEVEEEEELFESEEDEEEDRD